MLTVSVTGWLIMRLTVHLMTGKTIIIEADPNIDVKQLKANLHKHTGLYS